MTLLVAPCSYEAAKYAVEHWHYSKTMPAGRNVTLGVWEADVFTGAVVFGFSANKDVVAPYGLRAHEGCELRRVALRNHDAPVTQIVGASLRLLKRSNPGLRLVVSFADPEQGHVGGIYQAGNWTYAGTTTPTDEYLVNGKRYQGRALRNTRANGRYRHIQATNVLEWARKTLDPNARVVPGSSKHRYLYPLDRAMRRQIAPLAKPYPKRAAEVSTGHA